MSNPQHIFTRVGGTRFVATMACGAASVYLRSKGLLTGEEYVELGKWTFSVFIAGNASQNIASFIANRKNKQPENNEGGNDSNRQY